LPDNFANKTFSKLPTLATTVSVLFSGALFLSAVSSAKEAPENICKSPNNNYKNNHFFGKYFFMVLPSF